MAYPWVTDIELGQVGNSFPSAPVNSQDLDRNYLRDIYDRLSSWTIRYTSEASKKCDGSRRPMQIEDNPRGYPRFSALIASHDYFHLCRRFSYLRSRLLLLKQDKLSSLEDQLRRLDRQETETLRLGSCRADDNSERSSILSQIDNALADYDGLVMRNQQILRFETARLQAVSSLQNWINGTGCIARAETAYLNYPDDLLSVAPRDDTVMIWLETLAVKALIRLQRWFGRHHHRAVSRDPKVHIMPRASTTRTARVLMTPFIVTLLLAPVIVCNRLDTITARLLTIVIAVTGFIAVLSGSTRARAVELMVAGATYTTVLIVFISSTNVSKN